MNEKLFSIIKDIMIPIVTTTIPLITSLFTAKRNISFSKRRYLAFKEIRKDYFEDKINGYYFFQSFIGLSIPKEQIDYILNSENAFSIIKIIKTAYGKYDFKKGKFYSLLKRRHYIFPVTLYFFSALFIIMPIVFYKEILGRVKIYDYILSSIFIVCIFVPMLINSIQRIREIACTRYLERITRKRNKRSEERRVGKECRSRWSPYH